ncbi:phosphatidylinositol phosphate synthase [Bailinhaonella thermotolerans]|uniref:Phosphatidylinositol phosphate synthase n=1 Tax=Bailinhaonella thermotolerans TaxID=1070861 RepID=A0A3A4B177_9ACTN|nr:CDP-alcohol phosphatidyltransferase family protein [Bailinhaonella thermotolerans]RJL34589.1 CDP-alcohol phosphatidyltransferase family protein [Bailinhaonella thermotolerans]
MLKVLRPAMTRALTPLGRVLARAGVTPNMITVVGTLGVVASALALYPAGQLWWGSVLITVFVLFDLLDGVLARQTGRTGPFGAFLDSTMDRLADAAIFSGLLLYFVSREEDLLAGLSLFCLVGGALVSYARARAEGLGMTCTVGLAERAERLVVILVAAGFSGLGVPYILAAGLWLLSAASAVTVAQRFAAVYRQAVPPKISDRAEER